VQGITKHYDRRAAVVDLTFSVPRGQVLGFLGPEGAGKSTTMRILAGSLRATSGTASVAGRDVAERSREARQHIGYLPETTPLYDDMRVAPYLETMCRLRGVRPGLRRVRVDDALAACGLTERRGEVIGGLPGWQRLRVGLAQAVVHAPAVLLLDAPVAALDPDAAAEARALIGELARGRTAVVTGRALSDVAGICERVLVIRAGRSVAMDTLPNLNSRVARPRGHEVTAVVGGRGGDAAAVLRRVRALPGVTDANLSDAEGEGDRRLTVTCEGEEVQDAVARVVIEHGLRLKELSSRERSGEDALATLMPEEAR